MRRYPTFQDSSLGAVQQSAEMRCRKKEQKKSNANEQSPNCVCFTPALLSEAAPARFYNKFDLLSANDLITFPVKNQSIK
jgi:hypothetical protein